jgi:RNA polymerase sigma factor (sigma-70 family)
VGETVMHALEPAHTDAAEVPLDDAPQLRRFEALYRGEFAFVWSVAQHLGVSAGTIDDVVQDVFLTAYRRIDSLRFEVSPRAWLFGVTRRVASRYRRGAARRARRHTAFAEVTRPVGDAPQHRHDHAQQLARLLARLSHNTREVWQMTELLGMSAPEIASELGLPLNTVYSRLRIAREQLQTLVAAESLESLQASARRRQEPPDGAQQRAWALMLPLFGQGGSSVGVVAWMKTQTAMATTWIAAGVVAIGLAVRPASPPSERRPPTAEAPARVSSAEAAPPREVVETSVAAPVLPVAAPATPVVDRRMSRGTAPLQVGEARALLAEEIALIDRVHAQLAQGDAAAALATIGAHAGEFPAGALADVREAARVDALCKRGDAAGAEATARRLLVDHPASAVAQRFANFRCPR